MPKEKPKCFISYSHKDKDFCEKFRNYFSMLKRLIDTDVWYDGEIPAGGKISKEVEKQLLKADVVFLLITPDYITSEWCYEKEMECALKRNEKGECIVIPVIIKKILSGEYPFNDLKFVPTDGRAVTNFRSHNDGFIDAFNAIKVMLQSFYKDDSNTKPDAQNDSRKSKPKKIAKTDNSVKYNSIVNGRLKTRNLNGAIFEKILACNNALPAFIADIISVTKDCYDSLCQKLSNKRITAQDRIYWQRRCMEDFLFQTATYLQQHFVGIDNTCVHFRVCKTATYDDFLEVGYNNTGLSKEPIAALNGMIDTATKNAFPAIKSNNKDLHKVSHPNETTQRDYITCFLGSLYEMHGVKVSLCISIVGRHTTEIQNTLTALSIIRIDNLIDKLINQYIYLCVEADTKYDVCQIFNK